MKKAVAVFSVGLLVGVFRAFVLMNLWDWFVTSVFHVAEISFLQVLGLSLVIQLFTGADDKSEEDMKWGIAWKALEFCVPDNKMEDFQQAMKEMEDGVWSQVGVMIAGKFFGTAFVLFFGFVIHLLMGRA